MAEVQPVSPLRQRMIGDMTIRNPSRRRPNNPTSTRSPNSAAIAAGQAQRIAELALTRNTAPLPSASRQAAITPITRSRRSAE
jgi:hypothetical protein